MLTKDESKRGRISISLEKKMKVIRRMESEEKRHDVCTIMNLPSSTVTTIMKNSGKIKQSA